MRIRNKIENGCWVQARWPLQSVMRRSLEVEVPSNQVVTISLVSCAGLGIETDTGTRGDVHHV